MSRKSGIDPQQQGLECAVCLKPLALCPLLRKYPQIVTRTYSRFTSLLPAIHRILDYLGFSYLGLSYHESAARLGGGLSSSCFSFGGVVGLGDGAAAISLATASAICTSNTAITC